MTNGLLWTRAREGPMRPALLACFHVGVGMLYLPIPLLQGTPALVVLVAGLILNLVCGPLEWALGVLAFSFLAASAESLSELFQTLRWVSLGAAGIILPLRFFFRRSAGRRATFNRFDYLMIVFLVVAGLTLTTSLSTWLSMLKLVALAGLFYVVSQAARHLVEQHGPTAPRHLVAGLLPFAGAMIALPIAARLLGFGAGTMYLGWFRGYQGHPNAWGALVAAALPWMSVPLLRRAQWWSVRQWALLGGVVLVFSSLLWSGSRAGLLGVAVSVTILCLVHANRRIGALVAVVSVSFLARSLVEPDFIPDLIQRYVIKHRGRVDILQSRKQPWQTIWKQVEARPWLGMGFGVSSEAQSDFTLGVTTRSGMESGGSVGGTLSQVGIVGASVVFAALLGLLVQGARFCWGVRDPSFTAIYASIAALSVNALFEGWLLAPGSFASIYYWLQCYFLNAVMCRYTPVRGRRPTAPARASSPPTLAGAAS